MVHTRIPLWMALLGCGGSLLLGAGLLPMRAVRAQAKAEKSEKPGKDGESAAPTEYPYLPARYGEAYIPSVAEWQAIRLTSLGASTTRLTEQFSRRHITCFTTPRGLLMTLDLQPTPECKVYAGGKLVGPPEKSKAEIEKTVSLTMKFVRNFFSEVKDEDAAIRVFVDSASIGIWEHGVFTLNSEKPAAAPK